MMKLLISPTQSASINNSYKSFNTSPISPNSSSSSSYHHQPQHHRSPRSSFSVFGSAGGGTTSSKLRRRARLLTLLILAGALGTYLGYLSSQRRHSRLNFHNVSDELSRLPDPFLNTNTNNKAKEGAPTDTAPPLSYPPLAFVPDLDPPSPSVYISTILAAYPINPDLDGACAIHHNTAFMHPPGEKSNVKVCAKPSPQHLAVTAHLADLIPTPQSNSGTPTTPTNQILQQHPSRNKHNNNPDQRPDDYTVIAKEVLQNFSPDIGDTYLGRLQFFKAAKERARLVKLSAASLKKEIPFKQRQMEELDFKKKGHQKHEKHYPGMAGGFKKRRRSDSPAPAADPGGVIAEVTEHDAVPSVPRIYPGMTTIECSEIESTLPERFCRTRNIAIKVDRIPQKNPSSGRLELPFGQDSLIATCALNEKWWFGDEMFGAGAAGSMFDGLNFLDPNTEGIECDAWVETPLFMISRWDTTNPYQAHQDFLNAFIVYSNLNIDVSKVQPVILDSRSSDGPYINAFSYAFATDKPIVDIRELPYLDRLVTPTPIPPQAKKPNPILCMKDVVWGIHGGISSMSRHGSFKALCNRSQLLWSFRSFMLNRIRRAVIGPKLWHIGRDVNSNNRRDTCNTGAVFKQSQAGYKKSQRLFGPALVGPTDLVASSSSASSVGKKSDQQQRLQKFNPPTVTKVELIHGWEIPRGKCKFQVPLLVPEQHVLPSEKPVMDALRAYIASEAQAATKQQAESNKRSRESAWEKLMDTLSKDGGDTQIDDDDNGNGNRNGTTPQPPHSDYTFTITYSIRSTPSQGLPISGSLQLPAPWHHEGLFDIALNMSGGNQGTNTAKLTRPLLNEEEVIQTIRKAAKDWSAAKTRYLQKDNTGLNIVGLSDLFGSSNKDKDKKDKKDKNKGTNDPSELRKLPRIEVRAVDFARLSFEDQVAVAQSTDVFVAPHGAVFAHLLYLRSHPVASVLELKPPERRAGNWQFRNLCHMLRHRYLEQIIERKATAVQLTGIRTQMFKLLEDAYELRRGAIEAQEKGLTWHIPQTTEPAPL